MADIITATPTNWDQIVLVCRKCSKKLHGGFGPDGDDTLTRALKAELRQTGRRRSVRVIEAKCFGLCPKGAVTVLPGAAPGRFLTVPKATSAADVLASLPPA